MNTKSVITVVAAIVCVIGGGILSAIPVSFLMGDSTMVMVDLFTCAIVSLAIGVFAYYKFHPQNFKLGIREGFAIVTFGWIAAAAFGALPFIFICDINWFDAYFETMSGFTTTGASVLDSSLELSNGHKLTKGIANLPYGVIYWRSMTHWFGGMGIVVLSLAILPFLGIGGQQLYNAEVPGPTSDQLTPRIASSAKILWGVYVLLSVLETILLCLGGMSLFDSWCHTCGTMATGGFSTMQSSVGAFNSVYIDVIIIIFMFLAGCNFVLHYRALLGKPLFYFKDDEFKFYGLVTLISILTITLCIWGGPITVTTGEVIKGTFGQSLRYAAFQVVSIMTTTGFCTADFNIWPTYAALLLVVLMFVGGCGGSTGGGMKNSRVLLLLKYGTEQVRRCFFPHAVSNIHMNKSIIDSQTLHKVLTFFFLFVSLFVAFALLLTLLDTRPEMDFVTATSASIATLGNIGPGLGNVGATSTYSWMTAPSKILLTFSMLLGRLEIYTVLVLLLPSFWKK